MYITVIGISHKTAPIEIREKFYLDEVRCRLLLSELRNDPAVVEAFVVSTCNRTEVYAHTIVSDAVGILLQSIFRVKSIPFSAELAQYFYAYKDRDAVSHLLRVSSGLDSVVFGENQILGQVKKAVDQAREGALLSHTFNILAAVAIRTGKKVRHETEVGAGGISVSWAAVSAAERILGTLKGRSVLMIGAGKMANLAANQLRNKQTGDIYVINRSMENAQALAEQFGGTAVPFWKMEEILASVDVCLCSSGAPHYLIEKEMVQKIMAARSHKPLICIDISVPRNIDPQVVQVPNVSLISVDDLGEIVNETMQRRCDALNQVEDIVSQKIEEFYSKIAKNHAVKIADSLDIVAA